MSLIWYNPSDSSYRVGSQIEYEIQKQNCEHPEEMEILYELDSTSIKLAEKIVAELNAARTELRSA